MRFGLRDPHRMWLWLRDVFSFPGSRSQPRRKTYGILGCVRFGPLPEQPDAENLMRALDWRSRDELPPSYYSGGIDPPKIGIR